MDRLRIPTQPSSKEYFQPRGERAQWRVIYDRLVSMRIGDLVTDEELHALLPGVQQGSVVSAFHQAMRAMEKEHQRTFERVRTVGYKMVDAIDHERLARGQHKKARRRLRRGSQIIGAADRSRLTPEDRQRFDQMQSNLNKQYSLIRQIEERQERADRRLAQADQRLGSVEKDGVHLSDRLDRLEQLLRSHGITND